MSRSALTLRHVRPSRRYPLAVIYERLQIARAAVLVLGGFAALCVAAFLWSVIAGWVAVGASLLVIEFLTNPQTASALAARGERR